MKTRNILLAVLISASLFLALFWFLGHAAAPVQARGTERPQAPIGVTRYVATTGNDNGACTTIISSCASVQYAVDQAGNGDEILVATGIYTGVGRRAGVTQTLYLSKTVTVRGGYSVDFGAWNPAQYTTTLDAQGAGRVAYITENISPTLEGLYLTGGNASLGGNSSWGGGIYIYHATAIISGSTIQDNTADEGGGLYVGWSSNVTLINNIVQDNTADYDGGGLYVGWNSALILSSNTVLSNTANYGGGLCVGWGSNATLSSNLVLSNTASYSGGGMYVSQSSVTMNGNEVYGNTANHYSGGLYVGNYSGARLKNDVIADNESAGEGGGLYVADSYSYLRHVTLARNQGKSGVYVGLSPAPRDTVIMTDTILVSHTVGISITAGSTATLEATLWGSSAWANTTDWDGAGALVTGTVNIWDDPAFVDPDGGDYHITSASAAVDAGVNAGLTTDMDGDTRPFGSGYDIGADECVYHNIYLPLVMRNR